MNFRILVIAISGERIFAAWPKVAIHAKKGGDSSTGRVAVKYFSSIGMSITFFAELVNHRIRKPIDEANTHLGLFAVELLKHFVFPCRQGFRIKLFLSVPFLLEWVGNALHAVNAEGVELAFVRIGVEVLVSVVP